MGKDYILERILGKCEFKKPDSNSLNNKSVVLCTSSGFCAYSERAEIWNGEFRKNCGYN